MKPNNKKFALRLIPQIYMTLCTVLFTVGFSLFAYTENLPKPYVVAICVALYLIVAVGGYIVLRRICSGKPSEYGEYIDSDVFHIFASKYNLPVAVMNEEARIEWMNAAFAELFEDESDLKGKQLSDITDNVKLGEIHSKGKEGLEATLCGRSFVLRSFKTSSAENVRFALVCTPSDEIKQVRESYEKKRTVMAYIILDNLDSSVVPMQDEARAAAAKAQKLLFEWADEMGALIREYERDKYIVAFDGEDLDALRKDGFSILDKIRQIKIQGTDICVTASGGVADINGTLAEKESAASSALETALQRGGDQIVYKDDEKVFYYGGTVKSTINASRVLARMYAVMLEKLIKSAENVVIMSHKNIDYDGFGACIGIAKIAMYLGVRVNIVSNISREESEHVYKDKNLEICLQTARKMPEYERVFVNKAEAQDMMSPETLLIITDANNPNVFEAPELVQSTEKLVFIDHHRKAPENTFEAEMMYISPTASSACEMISEILEELLPQGILQKQEANLMFAGITLDTKNFSRSCSVRTYSAAQYLRRQGADQSDVAKFFTVTQDDFNKEMKFHKDFKIYRGKYAIAVKTDEGLPEEAADDKITASRVADSLLEIEGIAASFAICKIGDTVNLSVRSNGKINIGKMMEKFGGGGHYQSAGAQVTDMTLEQVARKLRTVIDDHEAGKLDGDIKKPKDNEN